MICRLRLNFRISLRRFPFFSREYKFLKMQLVFLLLSLLTLPMRGEASCTVEARINRPITAITLDIVRNTIKFTKQENCHSILFTIDTPGGSLPATREIVQEILNSPYRHFMPDKPFRRPGNQRRGYHSAILSCQRRP